MEGPKVGVAVIIKKDNKVLLCERQGAHGANTWAFPGGHLEAGEEPEECALREVNEEAGVGVENIRRETFTNDIFEKEGRHYITIFLTADWKVGEPEIREPDKCLGWNWFAWDNLPRPLFLPIENLLKTKYSPF